MQKYKYTRNENGKTENSKSERIIKSLQDINLQIALSVILYLRIITLNLHHTHTKGTGESYSRQNIRSFWRNNASKCQGIGTGEWSCILFPNSRDKSGLIIKLTNYLIRSMLYLVRAYTVLGLSGKYYEGSVIRKPIVNG